MQVDPLDTYPEILIAYLSLANLVTIISTHCDDPPCELGPLRMCVPVRITTGKTAKQMRGWPIESPTSQAYSCLLVTGQCG